MPQDAIRRAVQRGIAAKVQELVEDDVAKRHLPVALAQSTNLNRIGEYKQPKAWPHRHGSTIICSGWICVSEPPIREFYDDGVGRRAERERRCQLGDRGGDCDARQRRLRDTRRLQCAVMQQAQLAFQIAHALNFTVPEVKAFHQSRPYCVEDELLFRGA